MRYTLLIALVLNLNIITFGQAENKVFERVIKDYVLKILQPNIRHATITLLILDSPKYLRNVNVDEFSKFKEKYRGLEDQTFLDFVNKSRAGLRLFSSGFSDIRIVLVSSQQSQNRKELRELYPNWNRSIVEFSNIGFNEKKDQALVYYGFDSGPGVGGGIYIVLEKKRKAWKCKKVIPAWAA